MILCYAETLKLRLEIETDADNTTLMLQGASNILYKHYKKHASQFSYLHKFIPNSTNKDLIDDLKMLLSWFDYVSVIIMISLNKLIKLNIFQI